MLGLSMTEISTLLGYVDSDFVDDLNRRRSLTYYDFTFASSAINCRVVLPSGELSLYTPVDVGQKPNYVNHVSLCACYLLCVLLRP